MIKVVSRKGLDGIVRMGVLSNSSTYSGQHLVYYVRIIFSLVNLRDSGTKYLYPVSMEEVAVKQSTFHGPKYNTDLGG